MSETPESIVANGKAVFGTFKKVPKTLDIKGIRHPFGFLPFPSFITNFRIKSRIAYMFSVGDYIGLIDFFDDKLFGIAEVIFWYRSTGKKFIYHSFMLPRFRFVPIRLDEAVCVNHKKSRYIRILWSRKYDHISISFNVKGDNKRPSANGSFSANFSSPLTSELVVVSPSPTTRRCSASYINTMSIRASLNITGKDNSTNIENVEGLACMAMNRTYYKYHSKSEMMCGLGEYEGKKLLFRFVTTSADSKEADDCNENIVSLEGNITPMPAVTITHSFGVEKQWVVQDTESMVDLTFTPISLTKRVLNIMIMRTDYSTIYGTFDGVLLTGNGEKLTLKNFPGIIKKNMLRI